MTLTAAALKVLDAAQSGALDNVDQPLRELNSLLTADLAKADVCSAKPILEDACKAAYAHRFRIVHSLRQLEQSDLYRGAKPAERASWELTG